MMRIRAGLGSIAVVAITAMTMVAFSPLASTAGAHQATEMSTCRGSAARLNTPILNLEPVVVQNAPNQHCTAQSKTLIGPINVPGLINVSVGSANTKISGTANHPVTTSQVTGLNVSLLGLISIGADVITAQASAGKCTVPFGTPTSKPTLTSSGQIANLRINGQLIDVGTQPVHIDVLNLHLAFIDANQVTTTVVPTPTGLYNIKRTAFSLTVPSLGIALTLAESQAGFVGHPCDAV